MAQENCSHDCGNCQQKCSEAEKPDFRVAANALSDVKKVVGVVSGKGGVGKSLVTSLLASAMQKKGRQCGILDADITGPSIPKMFGVDAMAAANESGILPCRTKGGIDIMSVNLLMEDKATPVIWRGPAIAEVVKQFWSDVIWSYEDYLFVDMPPGTGDVPLTVFQSLPVDGIVIVASPQELVSLIVEKALRMANGEGRTKETAAKYGLDFLGEIPIAPELAALCDAGNIEYYSADFLDKALEKLEALDK